MALGSSRRPSVAITCDTAAIASLHRNQNGSNGTKTLDGMPKLLDIVIEFPIVNNLAFETGAPAPFWTDTV